ncbi:hypothetical protein P9B03_02805 [Metasolibacillus meyeri]|uniref:IDEAL domain-containing protein n=1 Tax=Metasolibacillus meyeri TaxID=1071052 RepID=A0AAW9NNR0_9BACL|nr:hypothetical protein [Metasolibacillus meyeri]MEC1177403.1 hypothetical protein [Metasolibacillus meyeri]
MTQLNLKKMMAERGDTSFMYLEKETLQLVLQHLLQNVSSPNEEPIIAKLDSLMEQQQQQFEKLLEQLS